MLSKLHYFAKSFRAMSAARTINLPMSVRCLAPASTNKHYMLFSRPVHIKAQIDKINIPSKTKIALNAPLKENVSAATTNCNNRSFSSLEEKRTNHNVVLIIKGQGIGPECITAAQSVLAATGIPIRYDEGTLGYPDAGVLFPLLKEKAPAIYAEQFGSQDPKVVADTLEKEAKHEAKMYGNINDFYKNILKKLKPTVFEKVKKIVFELEKETLKKAIKASAVLKGALRTLDEGYEPSRNVTVRKAYEQYANIRRCVTLAPLADGKKGADILFVRENVEDLYASIEHRLAPDYPQALRHQTPEGCELICRAAFEVALRDGRKKVTALEKPNILKITGGLFKEVFLRVAKDYSKEKLGDSAIEANFMIIDDGLAAMAETTEKFDVIVTTNMFGDIGSDIAAKITGGVGLVSSNNLNPINPHAVSMFETMGGTADDIAGQNKANPVALIDAAAEMLLHIGGRDNILAAEMIKTAILEVLADGFYVGDIKKGSYQAMKAKEKLGTQEFAAKIAEKVMQLKTIKAKHPEKTIKQIALERSGEEVKPLFEKVLRSYEQHANEMRPGNRRWIDYVNRNLPPHPPRSHSTIVGFDLFVEDTGARPVFNKDGSINTKTSKLDLETVVRFTQKSGIDLDKLFNIGTLSGVQETRSVGQYLSRILKEYLNEHPNKSSYRLSDLIKEVGFNKRIADIISDRLKQSDLTTTVAELEKFSLQSRQLIEFFYLARASEIEPILKANGFALVRITNRGTEIYPTFCDFHKSSVDRFRIKVDPNGSLIKAIANKDTYHVIVESKILAVKQELIRKGWKIRQTISNCNFTDAEGPNQGKELSGVSIPYAQGLGEDYREPSRSLSFR